ncbi:MAG: CAP domain-containing protein [Fibrobacterota bacterium]|nr:CAP domain-containing protein [Fibrobacterota bacterium]
MRWTESETCADGQAKSDSESGKAHGAFGDCQEWAQNECPGWGSVQSTIDGCLQSMWDERLKPGGEQGHYKNISSSKYTRVACGFSETPKGKVWALQNFKS